MVGYALGLTTFVAHTCRGKNIAGTYILAAFVQNKCNFILCVWWIQLEMTVTPSQKGLGFENESSNCINF